MVAGRVNSLAKTVGATSVNDYRPIVIYSFVYRIWSSVQARRLLDAADGWADPALFGNRRGKHAAHLWRALLHDIELSRDAGLPMSGLMCDIEKAYNCLPRWPVVCAALYAGTPAQVLNGWCGAMAGMRRHFQVRDSFSPGAPTSTGLAEGDALSCYGMLLIDHLLHCWLKAMHPSLSVFSYVDDWSFVTVDPNAAVKQLDAAMDFCRMCDLTLDLKKTFGWSVDPCVRAALRQQGLKVRHSAKDLGAHLAFSKQFTNSTLKDRFVTLDQFWDSLRLSKACYARKVFAVKAVAWPRGLYGISSAPIGQSVWLALRRKASAALGMKRAGVNPLVLLGLVEEARDPFHVAVALTVRDAREFVSAMHWSESVWPFSCGLLDLAPNAPSRILAERLHSLGFTICPDGHIADRFGSFDLLQGNFAEWQLRLSWQWQLFVGSQLAHRATFEGLSLVDFGAVRVVLSTLPADQAALYRMSLTGGFFTSDAAKHWSHSEGLCKWCHGPDSLQHRLWECPQTQSLRIRHAPRTRTCWTDLPKALALHGWAIRPPTWFPFVQQLVSLPDHVPPLGASLKCSDWNHVFTDGSCFCQCSPDVRIAGWSALLACPLTSDWHLSHAGVLGSGVLPGLVQTSFRAELYALAFVLHHAASCLARVVVWTDCLSVLRRYHLLTQGKVRLKANTANADLWQWILRSLDVLGIEAVQVRKVQAHTKLRDATSRAQFWESWNNDQADKLAKRANLTRPTAFWDLWFAHSTATATARDLFSEVWKLHIAVGQLSVQDSAQETLDEVQEPARPAARTFEVQFQVPERPKPLELRFTSEYGGPMSQRLFKWWTARVVACKDLLVDWISVAHMYVGYQQTFGCPGPIQHGSSWLDPLQRPYLEPERHPFHKRLKWFKRMVKLFCTTHGFEVGFASCRPKSDIVKAYVQCCSVPWDPWVLSQSERWIAVNANGPIVRDAKALRSLPLAQQHLGMKLADESLNG